KPQVACFSGLELKPRRNLECRMRRGWIDAMASGIAEALDAEALEHKGGLRADEGLCCLTLFRMEHLLTDQPNGRLAHVVADGPFGAFAAITRWITYRKSV